MSTKLIGLIPAAGSGTRLYPFSRAVPKEMYPILGKAVIEHCIENLKEAEIEKMFIVVGHQKGALMDYVGDGSFLDTKIAYIYQSERKGLGHAILQSENWIKDPFLVMLGDSFIEPKEEIKTLVSVHQKEKPIATVLLFETNNPEAYGIAKLSSTEMGYGPVDRLVEKPTTDQKEQVKTGEKYYAITGAYVFEPEIFDYIKRTPPGAKNEIQITDSIALALQDGKKVLGVLLKGKYLDIGKWKTVLNVEKEMVQRNDLGSYVANRENIVEKMKSSD